MKKSISYEKQPEVTYIPIEGTNDATVFIFLHEEEKQDDEGFIFYEYDFNEMKIDRDKFPEELIKSSPETYLNYVEIKPTMEERLAMVEDIIQDLVMGSLK